MSLIINVLNNFNEIPRIGITVPRSDGTFNNDGVILTHDFSLQKTEGIWAVDVSFNNDLNWKRLKIKDLVLSGVSQDTIDDILEYLELFQR